MLGLAHAVRVDVQRAPWRLSLAAWLAEAGLGAVRVQPLSPARHATGPALFAAAARRD